MPQFHVWFSTKRRRRLLLGDLAKLVEQALRKVAAQDGISLLECRAVVDHVHLLVELSSPDDLPGTMKALKGKSAHAVFVQIPELKLDARTNHLWQRGYAWKHVEPGAEPTIRRYISSQMERLEKFA